MLFNIKTAKIAKRRFDGGNHRVWADAHGNLQLCCYSQHEKGSVLVPKATIDAFIALPCDGEKSVRFANSVSRFDIVVELDQLAQLDAQKSDFGKPYYLVGSDHFSEEHGGYPALCSVG